MPTRVLVALMVAGTMSCASASGGPETGTTTSRTVAVAGMAGKLTVNSTTSASTTALAYSLDDVWRVLSAAFDSLGVTVGHVDPTQHVIGNDGYKLRVQLGRTPLSRYIDCGQTQIGQNADSYDVYLSVLAQVQAGASGGASLTTTLDAAARPISFSQDYSRCSSTGLFESRLVDTVKKLLQR